MKGHAFQSFAATAWPLAPRARRSERMRRVGVLHFSEHQPESKAYIATFLQQLGELGWMVGNNLQVDYRWTGGLEGRIYQYAAELVALAPDVVLAAGDFTCRPTAANHPHRTYRVRAGRRRSRRQIRQEPGASRR